MAELADALSFGNCALIVTGTAFLFQVKTSQHRSVQEPSVEKSLKGGKDAFVEPLRINTGLVRSRLRTPKLKLKQTVVGRKSRTAAAVLWIEGVADPALPEEMLRRLEAMDVDGVIMPDILDSGLADAPRSPFPQLLHTERPDTLSTLLLQGRVAVLVDGMPLAFAGPAFLPEFMKTSEDRSLHYLAASAIRLLRWAALFLSLLLPAFYVAVATFHAEMIPTKLLLSVIASKQSVPFSTAAEVLGMLLAFELLQEAGLRLPDPVGQTVSIIGALIVGQSAVDARVISPIAVIVVALAGIAGYTMPSQDLSTAIRLCRFGMAIAAALGGMFGIAAGALLLLWHLCSLETFGLPYMTPLTGAGGGDSGGVFIRRPPWKDLYRDKLINGGDIRKRK
ncbi:MAG: spore germination protein [Oscillospiraceae bacterium]|nr:spore germination protein [Oscillospiraceae bacterium]